MLSIKCFSESSPTFYNSIMMKLNFEAAKIHLWFTVHRRLVRGCWWAHRRILCPATWYQVGGDFAGIITPCSHGHDGNNTSFDKALLLAYTQNSFNQQGQSQSETFFYCDANKWNLFGREGLKWRETRKEETDKQVDRKTASLGDQIALSAA